MLYLRHVGFLGAHPPAVKGMRPLDFGELNPLLAEIAQRFYYAEPESIRSSNPLVSDAEARCIRQQSLIYRPL
ncbi:hypothetical protein D3C78_1799730 [compost metagenome]